MVGGAQHRNLPHRQMACSLFMMIAFETREQGTAGGAQHRILPHWQMSCFFFIMLMGKVLTHTTIGQ
jgi:hypothetical protein